MTIMTFEDACAAFDRCWEHLLSDCRRVLGSELHYQAMVYHHLRVHGGVPVTQLGMNVKQLVRNPVTALFQKKNNRKHPDYRPGFEPVPDIVIFGPALGGDWRRRNAEGTLKNMLAAIEVKVSEREKGRLTPGTVIGDIEKLAAHRAEVRHRGSDMFPLMLVIDTAPLPAERMNTRGLARIRAASELAGVSLYYLGAETEFRQRVASPPHAPQASSDDDVQRQPPLLPATLPDRAALDADALNG
jgi:hypothetical protein